MEESTCEGEILMFTLAIAHKHLDLLLFAIFYSLVLEFQSAGLACVCSELTNKCDSTLNTQQCIRKHNEFNLPLKRHSICISRYSTNGSTTSARVCIHCECAPHRITIQSTHHTVWPTHSTATAQCFERFHMRFVVILILAYL